MATCPKCAAAMSASAPLCPACGYDFPAQDPTMRRREVLSLEPRKGFAYSAFANIVLMLATFICGLASVVCLILAMASLTSGPFAQTISLCSSAIISGALGITFWRVLETD